MAGTVAIADGHVLYRSIRLFPLTDMMAPQADAEKGNVVADGASQDCRIDQANRYEYISAKGFSTAAGVLSHLGQRHIII